MTLAGLESAIPVPSAIGDKAQQQGAESSAAASLAFHTDKAEALPQYTAKIVDIDEAPPRQDFPGARHAIQAFEKTFLGCKQRVVPAASGEHEDAITEVF